jgi:signal transduction histidine kinase
MISENHEKLATYPSCLLLFSIGLTNLYTGLTIQNLLPMIGCVLYLILTEGSSSYRKITKITLLISIALTIAVQFQYIVPLYCLLIYTVPYTIWQSYISLSSQSLVSYLVLIIMLSTIVAMFPIPASVNSFQLKIVSIILTVCVAFSKIKYD